LAEAVGQFQGSYSTAKGLGKPSETRFGAWHRLAYDRNHIRPAARHPRYFGTYKPAQFQLIVDPSVVLYGNYVNFITVLIV